MSLDLIDEHAMPSLRIRLGELLANSRTACIAVTQLRLAGLDLKPGEVGRLEQCRIMLGQLDAAALHDSAAGNLTLLRSFATSGRIHIRTAPHHNWNPDFSIFERADGQRTTVLGAHYFGRPYPVFGLALTCILSDPESARFCSHRFDQLWDAGYDVLPVIVDTLHRLSA